MGARARSAAVAVPRATTVGRTSPKDVPESAPPTTRSTRCLPGQMTIGGMTAPHAESATVVRTRDGDASQVRWRTARSVASNRAGRATTTGEVDIPAFCPDQRQPGRSRTLELLARILPILLLIAGNDARFAGNSE